MKNKSVLDSFSLLKGDSPKLQIDSSISILNHLWTKQKETGLEEPCKELKHGLNRIVRGLGASTSNSRKGFFQTFVGLCNLFSSSSTITIQMCFDAIEKELTYYSSKEEENDVYKGKILAYGGLLYSGKILQGTSEDIKVLFSQINQIGCKKSYLMTAMHFFLVDWINKTDVMIFKKYIWNIFLTEILLKNKDNKSLQWYNLLFIVNEKVPELVNERLAKTLTGRSNIVHEDVLKSIGQLIVDTLKNSNDISLTLYDHLIYELVNNEKVFKEFWSMVNESLAFASPSTISNIFKLFIFCIHKLSDKNWITKLFQINFVQIFVTKSLENSVENSRLKTVIEFSKVLPRKDQLSPKSINIIIRKLCFDPGSLDFLQGPGLKAFQALASNFNEENVKSITKRFIDAVSGDSNIIHNKISVKKPWNIAQKERSCNMVIKLLNHPSVLNCLDWKVEQMKTFVDTAFFCKTTPRLSEITRKYFFSALDITFSNLNDLCLFLKGIVLCFDDKMTSEKHHMSFEFNKEMEKAWNRMLTTVNSIEDSNVNLNSELVKINEVFRVMFLFVGLMIFNDAKTAIGNLSELHAIYERMQLDLFDGKKIDASNEKELHWTDVTMDLLLSLLSYHSRYYRNVISKVFVFLCPHLSKQNITQILMLLDPNENVLSVENNAINSNDDDDDLEEENNQAMDEEEEEEEEEEGDDNDDEELLDLDGLDEDSELDEAIKAIKVAKDKKKMSAESKQLSDFRARVIDLLEIWMKTTPELNIVFEVMVAALILLEKTLQNRKNIGLQTKLKSFIKQLTSIKQFSINENLNSKELIELMKKLIAKDDKTSSVYINMSHEIVECCTFILKVSLREVKQVKKMRPLILEAYKSALYNFFNEKKSIVPVGLFKSAFMLQWEGSFQLIQDVLNHSLKPNATQFHLLNALGFLRIFLQNRRLLNADACQKHNDEIRQIAETLVDNINMLQEKPKKLRIQFFQICHLFRKLNIASDIMNTVDLNVLLKSVNAERKPENDLLLNGNPKKRKLSQEDITEIGESETVKTSSKSIKKVKKIKKVDSNLLAKNRRSNDRLEPGLLLNGSLKKRKNTR